MTQGTGDQLSIVPVFRVKFMRKAFDCGFVSSLVLELKIITGIAIFVLVFDDQAFVYPSRDQDTIIIIRQTGKDFIRLTVNQTNECNPFFAIVLETYHIRIQCFRTCRREDACIRTFIRIIAYLIIIRFFFLIISSNQYTATAAVTVYGNAFTAALPRFHIQFTNQVFCYIVRHVDGYADAMVYPLLDCTLHTHFGMIIHII
ncbi:hypothetical protein D3C87_1558040 [compost metagenome]